MRRLLLHAVVADLAFETKISPGVVAAALADLVDAGCIVQLEPGQFKAR